MGDWEKHFGERLEVDPPLADETLREIPAARGLAMLTAEGERPIVLLPAADMRSRIRNRLQEPPPEDGPSRMPDLRQITTAILWRRCFSHFETDLGFLRAARDIWPKRWRQMVAFKPAFFACVDAAEDCPHWVRSREVFSPADGVEGRPASSRRCFGPFATGRDADRFIEALQDAFELCRDPRCLRQSPDARRCAYGQIGRCLSPCDGTISMEQYRAEIRRSADYAAGRRGAFREHLAGQMKFLSSKLDFEQAGAVKQRLDRLAELDGPAFANVAPAEEFQWLAIQPGAGRQQAMGFAVDRGAVRTAKLEYPPKSGQLRKLLKTFRDSSPGRKNLPERRYVAGLVSQYLYGAESRRGLILRWRPDMKAEQLGETVRAAAEMLGLQEPSRRRKTGKSRKSGDVTDTGT